MVFRSTLGHAYWLNKHKGFKLSLKNAHILDPESMMRKMFNRVYDKIEVDVGRQIKRNLKRGIVGQRLNVKKKWGSTIDKRYIDNRCSL